MMIIRNIHPVSAFKVGFIINGFFGLVLGAFCTVAAVFATPFIHQMHTTMFGAAGAYMGYFAIVLCPLVYGMIGGIGAAIGALIYNLAAGWFGGLEIETA